MRSFAQYIFLCYFFGFKTVHIYFPITKIHTWPIISIRFQFTFKVWINCNEIFTFVPTLTVTRIKKNTSIQSHFMFTHLAQHQKCHEHFLCIHFPLRFRSHISRHIFMFIHSNDLFCSISDLIISKYKKNESIKYAHPCKHVNELDNSTIFEK